VVLQAARPPAPPDAADDGGAAAALDWAVEGEAGALGPAVVTVSVTVAVGATG
jgi:hypothetical protein